MNDFCNTIISFFIVVPTLPSEKNFNGYLYDGYLMVARKTFPTITKTEDLEFTITWTLTFG